MIKKTSGLFISKSDDYYIKIESNLNRLVRGWDNSVTKMKFYEESGDYILVPRFFPVTHDTIEDLSDVGCDIEIASSIQPNSDRQKKAINHLLNSNNGILQLEPGSGKTVIAIDVISKIKKRTIIFVHKDELLKQWKEEILKHTNILEEDISRLSINTYKEDLNKKIILSTVQTVLHGINSKTKSDDFIHHLQSSGIGVMFLDECHTTVGPEKFSQVSLLMNCKRVYGLSATPNRSDGNDDIIKWHLGDVVYFPPEIGELLKPIVYMIKFPFQIFSKNKSYLTWGGKFNLSRYHKQMIKSDNYFKNVNELLKKLYGQNRNILVLGTRKNSLLRLAKDISLNKDQIGFFVPTSTKNDRLSVSDTFNLKESFSTKRIVFSTYSACRDGNNRKDLDCLIMSTPTTNIDQAIGRILRILSDKKTPIVIDLIDTEGPIVTTKDGKKVPWFIRNSLTRKEKYIKNGWIIKEINLQLENQ